MDNTLIAWYLWTPRAAEKNYEPRLIEADFFVTTYPIEFLRPQVRDMMGEGQQYKYEALRLGQYKFALRKKKGTEPAESSEGTDESLFNSFRANPPVPLYKSDTQVWFIDNNVVKQGWVHFVNVEIEYSRRDAVRYNMDYRVKIYGETNVSKTFKENQLFLSKQLLLDSL